MSANSWSFLAAGVLLGLSLLGIGIAYLTGNKKNKDESSEEN